LCISNTRTDKKFGWQQITSGDANKDIEMMKFENNKNDKNIIGDIFQISQKNRKRKGLAEILGSRY
jgi:hypothetical protein